jgi:phenylalanyl-tRNA synthetase beta chain
MKFSIEWLQEYVDTGDLSPEVLAEHLTMLGLEVDSVEPIFPELSELQTAKILKVESHPEADKLNLCQVDTGDEVLSVVCGAPNVYEGMITAFAPVGTVMPGGMKIKASKVRGVKSFGMLCSEAELGLSESHDGIMDLPADTLHGQPLRKALGVDDLVVEVDLTPNRPDCASVIGIAREVAGVTRTPLTRPVEVATLENDSSNFRVDVENSELCPRYAAKLIQNVKIGPSPWWLRRRLLSVGLRPINNVVDVTNFVMMEYGQPLHAFDYDKISGKQIMVRNPRNKETTFTTLDGKERNIDNSMLMICDAEKPIAVAGVMGGLNSEVTADTTHILLESACFNPVSIRKTARKLNLGSEASYRFERGVDAGGCVVVLERAASLLCEVAGGTAARGGIDYFGGVRPLNSQTLRISRTASLLGIDLDYDKIADLLQSIGMRCKPKDENTLWVNPPTFRVDIEREVDLIEEVARLVGYNNIPTSLPSVHLSYPEKDPKRELRASISCLLADTGFTEAINYSFVTEKHQDMMQLNEEDPRRKLVRLLNPLSEEQSVMRSMLLPGLLENLKRNINFQKSAVKFFELGKVFSPQGEDEQPIEKERLTCILSGRRAGTSLSLYTDDAVVDIFDTKGVAELLFETLRLQGCGLEDAIFFRYPEENEREAFAEASQCLILDSKEGVVGQLAKIRPSVAKNFSIKPDVYFIDLDFDLLCSLQGAKKNFSSLPVFPSVKRDIALLVPITTKAGDMLETIKQSKEQFIETCEIFDVYQGKPLEKGMKSVAVSVTYRSPTKTLTEKNVHKSHTKLINLLTSKFNGSLREG